MDDKDFDILIKSMGLNSDSNNTSEANTEEEIERLIDICTMLEMVISNSYDGIYITDGDANTLYVNESYEKISGISREYLVGENLKNIQDEYISKSSALMALKDKSTVTIDQEFLKTGKKVLTTCKPIFDSNGEIYLTVSNIRDITELEDLKDKVQKEEQLVNKYLSELEAIKQQLFIAPDIVAESPEMLNVLQKASRAAHVDSTVLILGETGVGKEEVAKFIHQNSSRSKEHFIKVNCGAIAESLAESELFGYENGAFTGANANGKMGLFEVADGGTIFLDEIGELSLSMQVKLLRVLQENTLQRVGGVESIRVDVRVLAATNKSLEDMVKNGKFRDDLYYRINVIPLEIPPLRNRKADVIPLAEKFISEFNQKYNMRKKLSNEAKTSLLSYSWPGNVRELRNTIERSIIMTGAESFQNTDLPFNDMYILNNDDNGEDFDLNEIMHKTEYIYLKTAYEQHGNIRDAAKSVNMKHSAFGKKLKKYREKYEGG